MNESNSVAFAIFFAMLILALSTLHDNQNKHIKLILRYFIIFILVSLSALRVNIGTDYLEYKHLFDNNISTDPGYDFISYAVKLMGRNYQFLVFLTALITNFLIVNLFYKNSKKLYLSLCLYIGLWYYFGSWNLVRQYIAMSVICWQYTTINKFQPMKNIGLGIIASLFHITALPVAIILTAITYSQRITAAIFLLLVLFSFQYNQIIDLLPIDYSIQYLHYLDIDKKMNYTPFFLSLAGSIPIILTLMINKNTDTRREVTGLKLYFFGVIFMLLSVNNLFFSRISFYFLFLLTMLAPNTLNLISSRQFKYAYLSYYTIYSALVYFISIKQSRDGVIPFEFIL